MVVRYRRKKDGKVLTYTQPIPRLERSDKVDRVVDKPKVVPQPDPEPED